MPKSIAPSVQPQLEDGTMLVVLTVFVYAKDPPSVNFDVKGNLTILGDEDMIEYLDRSRASLERTGQIFFQAVVNGMDEPGAVTHETGGRA